MKWPTLQGLTMFTIFTMFTVFIYNAGRAAAVWHNYHCRLVTRGEGCSAAVLCAHTAVNTGQIKMATATCTTSQHQFRAHFES